MDPKRIISLAFPRATAQATEAVSSSSRAFHCLRNAASLRTVPDGDSALINKLKKKKKVFSLRWNVV